MTNHFILANPYSWFIFSMVFIGYNRKSSIRLACHFHPHQRLSFSTHPLADMTGGRLHKFFTRNTSSSTRSQRADKIWCSTGLSFSCTQCGKCCSGPNGQVRVNQKEMTAIHEFLPTSAMSDWFEPPVPLSPSPAQVSMNENKMWRIRQLREGKKSRRCIFLTPSGKCSIYPVRPVQCQTYPFWPEQIVSQYDWNRVRSECEGVRVEPIPDRSSETLVDFQHVMKLALIHHIHRDGSDPDVDDGHTFDELKALLDEIDPELMEDYQRDLFTQHSREVRYEDAEVLILDNFFPSHRPTRSFFFQKALHLSQSEVYLEESGSGGIDAQSLVFPVHQGMVAGISREPEKEDSHILILGAGTGTLAKHLNVLNQQWHITAVEKDPHVLDLGRRFFDFQPSAQLSIFAMSGEGFVKDGHQEKHHLYETILVDVDAGDAVVPPMTFICPHDYARLLSRDASGIVILNVMIHHRENQDQVLASMIATMKHVFTHVEVLELENNFILYATSMNTPNWSERKCQIESQVLVKAKGWMSLSNLI